MGFAGASAVGCLMATGVSRSGGPIPLEGVLESPGISEVENRRYSLASIYLSV